MSSLLIFAGLTIRESSRRRLLIAIALLTLVIVAATGWGFTKISDPGLNRGHPLSEVEVRLLASQMLILVAFMLAGILALSAVLIGAPSISAELESNQALALLARPVARWQYVLGKWLGLALLVVVYAVASGVLEMLAVRWATGYLPPHPVQLLLLISGEGLTLLTLALLLSTRLAGMTGGVVALILYFMAWIGGIVEGIGRTLNSSSLGDAGLAMRLILPTDALWRGAVYAMEPASVLALASSAGRAAAANPFMVREPIQPAMLAWAVAWVLAALGLAVWSFKTREV